jgi:hypothetical protein
MGGLISGGDERTTCAKDAPTGSGWA